MTSRRRATADTAPPAERPLQPAPGARVLWRGPDAVQWESGGRGVVVHGLAADAVAALLSDPEPAAGEARSALRAAGLLWRPPAAVSALRGTERLPERLLPDVGALVGRRGDDAAATMAARRARSVRVVGADRLAPAIASLLAAAGVGRVDLPLEGRVRLWQAMPGGLAVGDEGALRRDAAAAAVRAAAPEADVGGLDDSRAPDLTILTGPRPLADDVREHLHALGIPHLAAAVDAGRAAIGPLVVPGRTSCLRCADLHRADRDPAWPILAAQLSAADGRAEPADVALCATAAGVAALQALAFLDGEVPAVLDGSLELVLPDWRLRRRSRTPHGRCGCRAEAG